MNSNGMHVTKDIDCAASLDGVEFYPFQSTRPQGARPKECRCVPETKRERVIELLNGYLCDDEGVPEIADVIEAIYGKDA